MTFHSYGHGHKMQGPPCTSAKAFASFPFPWALQMHPPGHNNSQRNTQGHDEQQRLTMVVSVYPPKQGNVQWICTVLFPPSNHAQYQQYRSETCHSLWSTLRIHRLYFKNWTEQLKIKETNSKEGNVENNWPNWFDQSHLIRIRFHFNQYIQTQKCLQLHRIY